MWSRSGQVWPKSTRSRSTPIHVLPKSADQIRSISAHILSIPGQPWSDSAGDIPNSGEGGPNSCKVSRLISAAVGLRIRPAFQEIARPSFRDAKYDQRSIGLTGGGSDRKDGLSGVLEPCLEILPAVRPGSLGTPQSAPSRRTVSIGPHSRQTRCQEWLLPYDGASLGADSHEHRCNPHRAARRIWFWGSQDARGSCLAVRQSFL